MKNSNINFETMKTIKLIAFLLCITPMVVSCSDDDDGNGPIIINEEEVITTLTLTLTPAGGGTDIIMRSQDLDGDGPDAPVIIVSDDLVANTDYTGVAEFLNELVNPAEDITEEVIEEGAEHQVLYSFNGTSGSSISYDDADADGNPLGVEFTLSSGDASTDNTLTVTLKHEPTKPNDGTVASAGGETDVEATFTFNVN